MQYHAAIPHELQTTQVQCKPHHCRLKCKLQQYCQYHHHAQLYSYSCTSVIHFSTIHFQFRAEWKTSKSEMLNFSGRLWTTSRPWSHNGFRNHDQKSLLQNRANVNYVTQKIRKIMRHVKVRNLEIFQIINHVTALISFIELIFSTDLAYPMVG